MHTYCEDARSIKARLDNSTARVRRSSLLVAIRDGEHAGYVGLRIDGVELAGLDKRSDSRPVFRSSLVACKERISPIESYRPDGSCDAVVVDLDAVVGQKETRAR